MNLLESLFHAMQDPSPPAHLGEAFAVWTYFVALKEVRAICLLMTNHTADSELREFIEHFVTNIEEPQLKKLRELMRNEGIDFPTVTADKAKANPAHIPAGAKLTDEEISNVLVVKAQGLLVLAHGAMLQGLRPDLSAMWYRFHAEVLAESFKLKQMMQKRGWLRIPPQFRPGAANTSM